MLKTIGQLLSGAAVVLIMVIGMIFFVQANLQKSIRLIDYSSKQSSKGDDSLVETDISTVEIADRTYYATIPNEVAADPEEVEATDELQQAGQEYLSIRELSPQTTSTFNFDAIQTGDYTSIIGNWVNAAGYLIQFSEEGIELPGSLTLSDFNYGSSNELIATITSSKGISFEIRFYPAGVQIPATSFALTTEDPSDINQDRLVITRIDRLDFDSTESFVSRVYYRLPDQTETEESSSTETSSTSEETPSTTDDTVTTTESTTEESSENVEVAPQQSSEVVDTVYTSSYQAPATSGVQTLLE